MENSIDSQQVQGSKKPLNAAQRKANQRAREKAKKNGLYQPTILEEAKECLLKQKELDLAELLKEPKYKEGINEEQLKQLKVFVQNQKQRYKKDQESQLQVEQQVINIKEKAKRLGTQQIPQLHQALLTPQSTQERIDLIKLKIQENLFLFLDYMETFPTPSQDFLRIIIDLYDQFDEDTSTKLFARVCSMHRGETLSISSIMVQQAMKFLLEKKIDNIATFGLLQLVYQNNISFYDFPIQLLLDFQTQYEQTILNFFKSISLLKFQVIESLPPTCFTFTQPILKALKQGGDILHTQIPYHFLPYIIEILCFSFNNDDDIFLNFLEVLKDGCRRLYELLLQSDFYNLLQAISDKTKTMNNQFFRKLESTTQILERAFFLLTEKKIENFDQETVQILLNSNSEQLQILRQKPRICKKGTKTLLLQTFSQCLQQNTDLNIDNLFMNDYLSNDDLIAFKSMGIQNLLPIQEICYRYCTQINQNEKYFIKYDTGQGKTSLCLALAYQKFKQGYQVNIINYSKELAFRDFKRAFNIQNMLQTKIYWQFEGLLQDKSQIGISFWTLDEYLQFSRNSQSINLKQQLTIIDEYDYILFENVKHFQEIELLFQKQQFIVAFSGSDIQKCHQEYLKNKFNGKLINFSINNGITSKVQCQDIYFSQTYTQMNEKIIQLCQAQIKKTPIIIIMKEKFKTLQKQLTKQGIVVECLADGKIEVIESSMSIFTEKQNQQFQVFIINEVQGRGYDFPSNTEKENNGGVYVIITFLPSFYLQFNQFIGRTARVGNSGQYSIIITDKNAINCEPKQYLNKKLLELQNKDILNLASIANKQTLKQNIPMLQQTDLQYEIKNQNCSQDNYLIDQKCSQEEMQQDEVQVMDSKIIRGDMLIDQKPFTQISNKLQNFEKNVYKSESLTRKRVKKEYQKEQIRHSKRIQNLTDENKYIDQAYFDSYADPKIHEEMLNDKIRMEQYHTAISQKVRGQTVIDVGAGTGVLSLLAAKAGAKKVYAIEQSEIAKAAVDAIKDNDFGNTITVFKERAEDVELPIQKVDVIISEWMGYALIYENMLPQCFKQEIDTSKKKVQCYQIGLSYLFVVFKNKTVQMGQICHQQIKA